VNEILGSAAVRDLPLLLSVTSPHGERPGSYEYSAVPLWKPQMSPNRFAVTIWNPILPPRAFHLFIPAPVVCSKAL